MKRMAGQVIIAEAHIAQRNAEAEYDHFMEEDDLEPVVGSIGTVRHGPEAAYASPSGGGWLES